MKMSVCIPLFNGAWCIEDALDSLCLQVRKPDEVIIQDDVSLDKGNLLIEKYMRDLKIKFAINKNNLGMIGNWNECIARANGDIIAFLHQDDGYYPDFLNEVENDFINNNKIDLWTCEEGEKGCPDVRFVKISEYIGVINSKELLYNTFTWKDIPPPTTVVFRKKTLDNIGLYNLKYKYAAEPDLYFRFFIKGCHMFKSNKLLVWRTPSDTRASATLADTSLYYKERLYFLREHYIEVDNITLNDALKDYCQAAGKSISKNLSRLKLTEANNIYTVVDKVVVEFSDGQGVPKLNYLVFYKNIVFLTITMIFARIKNMPNFLKRYLSV